MQNLNYFCPIVCCPLLARINRILGTRMIGEAEEVKSGVTPHLPPVELEEEAEVPVELRGEAELPPVGIRYEAELPPVGVKDEAELLPQGLEYKAG